MQLQVLLTGVATRPSPINTRLPGLRTFAMLALGVVLSGCRDSLVRPVAPGTDAVARDRAALKALYDATEGPQWEQRRGWSTDAPLGEWHGVVTDSVGRVTWLTLPANGLKGTLPVELGSLSELQFLGLADNELDGPVPMELGNVSRLAGLFLKNNRLTGAIPESFLRLGQLRVLDFAGNRGLCVPGTAEFVEWAEGVSQVMGPDCSQGDWTALQQVFEATRGSEWIDGSGWLEYTLLEEWFGVEVDAIGRVRSLALGDNGLVGTLPEAVGDLFALRSLDVGGNELTGALPRSLTTLSLEDFRYADTGLCVPHDEDFREWLETVDQHEGTGVNCTPVAEREALIAFYKAADGPNWSRNGNWLTNVPIGEWDGVTVDSAGHVVELRLGFNSLKGAVPPALGSLPNLRWLELQGNWALTGPIPAEFFDLSQLRVLALYRVGLAGPLPPEIGMLTKLTRLDLRASGLGGPIPAELGELVNLVELHLSGNDFVGGIPPELGKLASLRTLSLYDNDLKGEIPPELGNLTNLQTLDIERNQLTGIIPGELGNLVDLELLWISDNKLTGAIPPAFGNMGRATRMYLHGNELIGSLPPEMGGLTELRQLWLGNNAGLSGPLPVELKTLRELDTFKAGGTGLCIPADAELMAWLDGVEFQRVARCESGAVVAYLTQAVQSRWFPVPLVAGRSALLRVFVSSPQAGGERIPPVRATFYDGDTEVHVAEIRGGSEPIPAKIDEGVMAQSANTQIPGDVIREGLEMVIDVDPDNTLDSGLGIAGRIPEVGRIAVDVREMPVFLLTVIPFLYEARPDSSILEITAGMANDPERSEMLSRTRDLLPIGVLDVRLHDPVVTWTDEGFHLLNQTEAMRRMEGVSGYWLGMLSPVPNGGLLGVALGIRSWSSFSVPESHIVAHELGHNMGLYHAPCGGAGGPDPLYPDRNGRIGSWGYDRERGRLVTPYTPDLMSYCHGGWIGDYHFSNSLRHRLDAEAQAARHTVPTRTLLVWGGLDSDGDPFLEPAFLVEAVPSQPAPGSEFRLSGRTVDGGQAFALTFDMPDLPDVDDGRSAFVFTVPETWSGTLASISLVGGGGSAILDQATDSPMTIVRDPVSGQVRAFLRGPEATAMAVGGVEPGMETLFSRGIPNEADQRR